VGESLAESSRKHKRYKYGDVPDNQEREIQAQKCTFGYIGGSVDIELNSEDIRSSALRASSLPLRSRLFMNGSFLLNEKFFFFLSIVEVCGREKKRIIIIK
jgi:hypothetical protein